MIAMNCCSKAAPSFHVARSFTLCVALGAIVGCGDKPPQLMPTPNLYAWGNFDPFEKVPAELQSNRVEVMYCTDRMPDGPSSDRPDYGYERSRSVAWGTCDLVIGDNVAWEQLVKASRAKNREVSLPLYVPRVRELGRLAPTPRKTFEVVDENVTPEAAAAAATQPSGYARDDTAAEEAFRRDLSARLAHTPSKEVFVYVHGFANNFYSGVNVVGELWHFMGRRGVPIAYTWPAGSPSLLRAYMYDRESSEFTVYHFKQVLKLIASCPDVEKVNIISHSRGTDVATSALRELHLEIRGTGLDTRKVLKLGTVVLAAPDLDVDVVVQRLTTDRIGQVPEHLALYVCSEDKALGVSNWLYGGETRLGRLRSSMFPPAELEAMRNDGSVQPIDARVSDPGAFGHSYFYSNPAVSSDVILLLRYDLAPGAENGRPLRVTKNSFWAIDDDYPRPPRGVSAQTSAK
jgi:esterase/lipase superfamily enzyme